MTHGNLPSPLPQLGLQELNAPTPPPSPPPAPPRDPPRRHTTPPAPPAPQRPSPPHPATTPRRQPHLCAPPHLRAQPHGTPEGTSTPRKMLPREKNAECSQDIPSQGVPSISTMRVMLLAKSRLLKIVRGIPVFLCDIKGGHRPERCSKVVRT